ncbi:MAG: tetratricopeptide repeat protein [Ekhidna sp.]
MSIKTSCICSLLILSLSSWANPKIDSLKNELYNHIGEDKRKVELLNNLGYEYWIINPVQSIIYGQQAKALAEILQDAPGLAFSNRVIGVAHWARGSYDKGLEYLLDGLSQYRELNNSLGEGNCLMNIGLIYADRSDNDLALEYYQQALELFEKSNAQNRSATTYVKIAAVLIKQGKLAQASDFLRKAELIHGAEDFFYGMSEVLNRYGLLKIETKEYDSANIYLKHALELSIRIEDKDGITKNYIDLARVALLGDDTKLAEELLIKGLTTAREIHSHKWLKEIYNSLLGISRKKGNLEQAIFYYDQYVLEKDSIFNEQTLKNISRLETELATTEQKRQLVAKENEIIVLEQKSAILHIRILILVLVIITIVASAIIITKNQRQKARRKEQKALKEAEEVKKELEFKKKELVSYTINFVQKNQLFEELMTTVSAIKKISSDEIRKEIINMDRTIKRHLQVDKDWEDFKLRFGNLHTGFFDKILAQEPTLTGNDLKLCALVKMSFSIKEISEMMGISTESVKTARYRLKKKLNLPGEMSVNDFLNSITT